MLFLFKTLRSFTTPLSLEETIRTIQEMISSRSKILFFKIQHYLGRVKGKNFVITNYSGHPTRLMAPIVKGEISHDNPTEVTLRFLLPIILTAFLTLLPVFLIYINFTVDEMTINGVTREPTITERIGLSVLWAIAVPGILLYAGIIRPLQKLHRDIKNKLKLEEKR